MGSEELKQWENDLRAQGKSEEEIKNAMKQAGYTSDQIAEDFPEKKKKLSGRRMALYCLLGFVVVIGIIAALVLPDMIEYNDGYLVAGIYSGDILSDYENCMSYIPMKQNLCKFSAISRAWVAGVEIPTDACAQATRHDAWGTLKLVDLMHGTSWRGSNDLDHFDPISMCSCLGDIDDFDFCLEDQGMMGLLEMKSVNALRENSI